MAVYQELFRSGGLRERVDKGKAYLKHCRLCGHECGVDRPADQLGKCDTGSEAVVSNYGPHFGEEVPLVGRGGSGTIFFTHCNLKCLYCQNYTISQSGEGITISPNVLAEMMLNLQQRGCHNINLVSPTHQVPQILEALEVAVERGLCLPLVYNTGGYDSPEVLALLDGIVDIYMPDMKYSDEAIARRFSLAWDYPLVNQKAIKEMHRQVGDLIIDEQGVARHGLLVRHLVLPGGLAGTEGVVRFLTEEISPNTYLNVMAQYRPCHHAFQVPELARTLRGEEFTEAVKLAYNHGMRRLDGFTPVVSAPASG